MINIIAGNFRICNITTITANGPTQKSEAYGLAIEKRATKADSWYVICFIKYDEGEQDYVIDSCGHRLLDIDEADWPTVHSMIESAGKIVCLTNCAEKSVEV